jgi:hypothetical protein
MVSAHHLRQGTEKQELLRLIGTSLEVPEVPPGLDLEGSPEAPGNSKNSTTF